MRSAPQGKLIFASSFPIRRLLAHSKSGASRFRNRSFKKMKQLLLERLYLKLAIPDLIVVILQKDPTTFIVCEIFPALKF